jgi:hypothetical protein
MTRKTLWSRLALLVATTALVMSTNVSPAQDDKDEKQPPRPPELKVLEKLVGTWDWETIAKPAVWTPEEVRAKGTLTRDWVLNRRFLQEKGGNADNPSVCMFTYDTNKKAYRFWMFNAAGNSLELTGQWNETTRTMTWKGDVGNGITTSGPMRFVDDDTTEWTAIARDSEGKVYHHMEGKVKRRK